MGTGTMGTFLVFEQSVLNKNGDVAIFRLKIRTVPILLGLLLWVVPLAQAETTVVVTLQPQVATPTTETVSFGLPLPSGLLTDSQLVTVFDGSTELPAYVEALVPWRGNGQTGIRSVLIQVSLAFSSSTPKTVTVQLGQPRQQSDPTKTPVVDTLLEPTGVQGPRVLASLPPDWLSNSWVAGPQVPAAQNTGEWKGYEQWTDKYFESTSADPGAKNYDLTTFEPWLYDRVTVLYKIYVRTGNSKYLKEAYRSANLYRQNIYTAGDCPSTSGPTPNPCIGMFRLKNTDPNAWYPDPKYSYSESPAIHYMLTGDERFLQTARDITVAIDRYGENPVYKSGQGWSERFIAFGWLAYMHAYEILGRAEDLQKTRNYANAVFTLQNNPPDGFPPDGCWRHYSTDHGESGTTLGCSPWMSSLMVGALHEYYLLTGDSRAVVSIQQFVDWLDKYGLTRQNYGGPPAPTMPFYFAVGNPLLVGQVPTQDNKPWWAPSGIGPIEKSWADGDETAHDMEMTYLFAAGYWASGKTNQHYLDRMREVFPVALNERGTTPPRKFNWALRDSPQLLHFLSPLSDPSPPQGLRVYLSSPSLAVPQGQSATLSWYTTQVTSCEASGAWSGSKAASGSQAVSPSQTTSYTLTCAGKGGTTVQNTVVLKTYPSFAVNEQVKAFVNVSIYPTPTQSRPALGLKVQGTLGTVTGSPVFAESYWWWPVNFDGLTGWTPDEFFISLTPAPSPPSAPTPTPSPAPIVSLSVFPATITTGQSSTLTWSSTNATSCTASGGWSGAKATSGSQTVSPSSTTTYSLTCTGAGGNAIKSATITVTSTTPPPSGPATLSFNAITGEQSGIAPLFRQWKADEIVRQARSGSGDPLWWWPWGVRLFDYDNDGDLDMLIAQHGRVGGMLLRNTFVETGRVGFYEAGSEIGMEHWELPGADGAPVIWDFDGDGRLDISSLSDEPRGYGALPTIVGEPSIKNVANDHFTIFGINTFFPVHVIYPADLDGDGDLDATGGVASESYKYVYNHVTGQYAATDLGSTPSIIPPQVSQAMRDEASALLRDFRTRINGGPDVVGHEVSGWDQPDFNRDGKKDALFALWTPFAPLTENQMRACITQADGVCREQTAAMGLPKNGVRIGSSDLNGDSYVDLLIDVGTQNGLYLNNGNGTFTLKPGDLTHIAQTRSYYSTARIYNSAADLDNDGDLDMIASLTGQMGWILQNQGNANFVSISGREGTNDKPAFVAWGREDIVVGDLNNDGLPDIVLGGSLPGKTTDEGSVDLTLLINTTPKASTNFVDIYARIPEPTLNPFAVGGSVSVWRAGDMARPGALPIISAAVPSDGTPVHAGLGSATAFDVRVRFPNGTIVEKTNVTDINTRLVFTPDSRVQPYIPESSLPIPSIPPNSVSLYAFPSSIVPGPGQQPSNLMWSSARSTSCTASGGWSGSKAIAGSQAVSPTSATSYTLTCTGPGGTASKSVTVTMVGPTPTPPTPSPPPPPPPSTPTVSLAAMPSSITAGETSSFSWFSIHATTCTASGGLWTGVRAISGTETVTPGTTTTYTLTCTGAGGSASQSVTVTVAPPAGVRGDLTGDGLVSLADLRRLIKMFLGLVPIDLAAADLTGDGALTLADLRALVGILVGGGS